MKYKKKKDKNNKSFMIDEDELNINEKEIDEDNWEYDDYRNIEEDSTTKLNHKKNIFEEVFRNKNEYSSTIQAKHEEIEGIFESIIERNGLTKKVEKKEVNELNIFDEVKGEKVEVENLFRNKNEYSSAIQAKHEEVEEMFESIIERDGLTGKVEKEEVNQLNIYDDVKDEDLENLFRNKNEYSSDIQSKHEEINEMFESIYVNTLSKGKGDNRGNIQSRGEVIKKEQKVSPYDLAKYIMENHNFIVSNNMVYSFENKRGYYKLLEDYELKKELRQSLPTDIKRKINNSSLNETVEWIKTSKEIQRNLRINEDYVNFINGYYNISTGEFIKYDRQHLYFGYYINSMYNIDASDGFYFEEYMNNVTNGDYDLRTLLQEILGVAISNIRSFKKAIFIIGCANSGKSSLLELINNLIGEEFVSSLSLSDLNDKFRLAELVGKRVNICGEVSEIPVRRLEVFKSVTGNDYLMAERKGEKPFKFKNSSLLIFAGNYLPELSATDTSNAFFKRMIIVPFNNAIPPEKIDIKLMDKLLEEKEYIVKFAIEGLRRFVLNDYKFTSCNAVNEITNNYLYENASFQKFIEERCILDNNGKESIKDLICAYEEFCCDKGVYPIPDKMFRKYMKQLNNVEYKKIRIGKETPYGCSGIRLTSEV